MSGRLVVFVPGVMGSGLRFVGEGPLGDPVDDVVWGEDPGVIVDSMARYPLRLASNEIQATEVLRTVKGRVWGKHVEVQFYGPLLDFCVEAEHTGGLGLKSESEFLPFAYDWRQDIRISAKQLSDRIKAFDPTDASSIGLVGHSMGGLICRLLLSEDSTLADRVKFFLQIASPIQGAAKAFEALTSGPVFNSGMDFVLKVKYHKDLNLKCDLMAVLRGLPSLFQLLPPVNVPILLTRAGALLPATERSAWLPDQHKHLEAAEAVHAIVSRAPTVKMRCVYASDHETAWCYCIDQHYRVTATYRERFGDETITSASAFEGSGVGCRVRVSDGETKHDELPRHIKVKELLKSLVGEMA